MQQLGQYPPPQYWEIATRQCAVSAETYLDLWPKQNEQNIVLIEDKEIVYTFGCPKIRFYRDILKLSRQGLITVKRIKDKENQKFLRIEMTGWDDEANYD
jgi:hypothetical protein